jgi:hypothetical protein
VVGGRVIIAEIIARASDVVDDPHSTGNTARLECLTFTEALTPGQSGHYSSTTITVQRDVRARAYRVRIDGHEAHFDEAETRRQVVMLAIADALRAHDTLDQLATDDPDWPHRAQAMVDRAFACGDAVHAQLTEHLW